MALVVVGEDDVRLTPVYENTPLSWMLLASQTFLSQNSGWLVGMNVVAAASDNLDLDCSFVSLIIYDLVA